MTINRGTRPTADPVADLATLPRTTTPGTDRRDRARLNLAAFALDRDDPAAWLRDVLGALGLLGRGAL